MALDLQYTSVTNEFGGYLKFALFGPIFIFVYTCLFLASAPIFAASRSINEPLNPTFENIDLCDVMLNTGISGSPESSTVSKISVAEVAGSWFPIFEKFPQLRRYWSLLTSFNEVHIALSGQSQEIIAKQKLRTYSSGFSQNLIGLDHAGYDLELKMETNGKSITSIQLKISAEYMDARSDKIKRLLWSLQTAASWATRVESDSEFSPQMSIQENGKSTTYPSQCFSLGCGMPSFKISEKTVGDVDVLIKDLPATALSMRFISYLQDAARLEVNDRELVTDGDGFQPPKLNNPHFLLTTPGTGNAPAKPITDDERFAKVVKKEDEKWFATQSSRFRAEALNFDGLINSSRVYQINDPRFGMLYVVFDKALRSPPTLRIFYSKNTGNRLGVTWFAKELISKWATQFGHSHLYERTLGYALIQSYPFEFQFYDHQNFVYSRDRGIYSEESEGRQVLSKMGVLSLLSSSHHIPNPKFREFDNFSHEPRFLSSTYALTEEDMKNLIRVLIDNYNITWFDWIK